MSHARNADHHTIQGTAAVEIEIRACLPAGGTAVIEIDHSSGHLAFRGVNGLSVSEPRYVLLPIRDRGVKFAVPTEHLGATISKNDPLTVAQLALAFYTQFVAEAAAKFGQRHP